MKWVTLFLGIAGLGLTAFLALQPNPLRTALVDFLQALTGLINRISF